MRGGTLEGGTATACRTPSPHNHPLTLPPSEAPWSGLELQGYRPRDDVTPHTALQAPLVPRVWGVGKGLGSPQEPRPRPGGGDGRPTGSPAPSPEENRPALYGGRRSPHRSAAAPVASSPLRAAAEGSKAGGGRGASKNSRLLLLRLQRPSSLRHRPPIGCCPALRDGRARQSQSEVHGRLRQWLYPRAGPRLPAG